MKRVVHGGLTNAELRAYQRWGIALVDLSASLNPYGPHRRVESAAWFAHVETYPEVDAATLRRAAARRYRTGRDQVLAGNGSSELLYLLCRAFAGPGRPSLIVGPTFGEYRAALEAAGAEPATFPLDRSTDFRLDAALLLERVRELRPQLTFLCNPNNPTGGLVPQETVEALTEACLEAGGRLVVDEAYLDFVHPAVPTAGPAPGRLVLRSLTKMHRVPGVRVGFLLGPADDVAAVERLQPPWAVSSPAAAAGLAALRQARFEERSRAKLAKTRQELSVRLTRAGLEVTPSEANFLLVKFPGPASKFCEALLGRGFAVRDCSSFGLPEHVRIAVPQNSQLRALVTAIREVLRG